MNGRRAVRWLAVLPGALLLLAVACAPAARVSQPAQQPVGTDATSTRPYIAPRPETQWPCAQGQAPPGHPLSWTEEERLRCFPPQFLPSTPRPDVDRSAIPTPDRSKFAPPEPEREIKLKGQRVTLPEGIWFLRIGSGACVMGRPCPRVMTLYKATSWDWDKATSWIGIDVTIEDPVVMTEHIGPGDDPGTFDFLRPYVRRPPDLGPSTAEPTPTGTP